MRRITVVFTTLAFALSGLTFSPASAEVPQVANATRVAFANGNQSATPASYFNSVSCSSAGNCVAAGGFLNAAGEFEAFTQTQTNGLWNYAIPATFASGIQHTTPVSYFGSVSCFSAGNCVAAGRFKNAAGGFEAFTQTETSGIWANAIPATFAVGIQHATPHAEFSSVSCSSAGNCVAAGSFKNAAGAREAFTQTQTSGIWANATPAAFANGIQNATQDAYFSSVSCSSDGWCEAVGLFLNAAGRYEGFTQTHYEGSSSNAVPVTFANGIQNTSPEAYLASVSCSNFGNCVAVGQFVNAVGDYEGFTQTQTGGSWANAIPVTFANGIQNATPEAYLDTVSCSSAGNCVAVGQFVNAAGRYEGFTQTQTSGIWADAIPVTFADGIQSSNRYSEFDSVSCSSVGNCVAVGDFNSAAAVFARESFTQTQTNGIWADARPVAFDPGIQHATPLNGLNAVSCSAAGNCVAVGSVKNAAGASEAFTQVLGQTTTEPTIPVINSITQAKAWANVDFTLPTLEKGSYDRVAYSINGGSWVSWGLYAKSAQTVKGLPRGREYSIRIRGHVKRGAWTEPSEPVTIFMSRIRRGVLVP